MERVLALKLIPQPRRVPLEPESGDLNQTAVDLNREVDTAEVKSPWDVISAEPRPNSLLF